MYLKRHRRGQEGAGCGCATGRRPPPKGLIRLVLRLTRRARQWAGLWVFLHLDSHRRIGAGANFRSPLALARLVKRHGLADNEHPQLHLRRLRKTYKAEFYRLTGGQRPPARPPSPPRPAPFVWHTGHARYQ